MKNEQLGIAIHKSIVAKDTETTIRLIRNNPEAMRITTPFGTWLHLAARYGDLALIKQLLELGADVNIRGWILEGNALQEAVSKGYIEIVKYLYSRGANLDTQEPEWNPLFSAIYNDQREIAQLLVDYGIDTKVKYTGKHMKNMGALEFAREQGKLEIAAMLERLE